MKNATEFLSDNDIRTALSNTLRLSGPVDIAVAYWGANAAKTLGIDLIADEVRIICDAYSGACNPDELERLCRMGNVQLRWRDGLHAKVFLTSECVIIGSANASANGLGQEGEEADNREAVALIRERRFSEQARSWFNALWRDSHCVTDKVIQEIVPIWRDRRRGRPTQKVDSSSLFRVLMDNPKWFSDREIRLIAYEGVNATKAAIAKFHVIAPDLYDSRAREKYQTSGELPFYEDDGKWNVFPGDYLVDYGIYSKTRVIFQGLWRVRSYDAFHSVNPRSRIILLDKARDFKGLTLSSSDARRLGKAVLRHVSDRNFETDSNRNMLDIPLEKVGDVMLPSKANA